ncbi:bifunctional biotin--[acetyl-CoA-carboxylase] ligase/biotin operon repressor BirA [Stutzerimonas azotifigens]|uniref:bifunctional biotin--[acetyl-CoA-carboxylase] ligase/biotin operon repressor BirA n=1 Tax=Stutzerimonas azotifigens TaxID=291995 RepID=UPI000488DFF3|nr:bifunctional biotin--[acetyl-CoA-carboxylase] ligase/biotin operon repressor BirA [Stutzerimonas azotifigens]
MLRLLTFLQDGDFHSGEEIGSSLGVSRASVWKQIARLEKETGLSIERVRGNGYRLPASLSLLNENRLTEALAELGWQLHFSHRIDSTNAKALALLREQGRPPFVVLAEQQTAGRGRRGRQWVSPFGANLYFTHVLAVDGGARQLSGISLAVGVAVLRTLRALGLEGAGLKWPNDLLVGEKKIAGILLELAGDPAGECEVVVGVGINVNMQEAHGLIDQPWTSLAQELGMTIDRTELAVQLARNLNEVLARQCQYGFAAVKAEWEASHLWQGRLVKLSAGANETVGVVLGVDDQGALRLESNGLEQRFNGGELSLRLHE